MTMLTSQSAEPSRLEARSPAACGRPADHDAGVPAIGETVDA